MKKLISIVIILVNVAFAQGQVFTADCQTDFWTITSDGFIQQWSLQNGSVSGGDTILSGGGTSLGFYGNSSMPTFFSNAFSPIGISYFDADSGWQHLPTDFAVDHNGGHLDHQYYRVEGAVIQLLTYWDGTKLITLDSLQGEFFVGVQDIGVDTLGQAWIFTGSGLERTDSLKVYNSTGKIDAYSIQFTHVAYGSFFLNDTLFIGSAQDSIYPIIINGSTAELGSPIYFPSNNYTDMASCQNTSLTSSPPAFLHHAPTLFPNPTHGFLNLPSGIDGSMISVFDFQGRKIDFQLMGDKLDIHKEKAGIYVVKIASKTWMGTQKIVKLGD